MNHERMIHLECARGIASLLVLFHHFSMAFCENIKPYLIISGLVNGSGAVSFFFTLSGFVLTLSLYRNLSLEKLLASVIKRLPRLMVPVGASVFIGYMVLEFTGSQYRLAASLSGSDWLRDFGNAHFPPNFSPSMLDALSQSLLVFIVPRNFYYNSNMWTMVNEFYGSMLVFGIVLLVVVKAINKFYIIEILHIGLIIILSMIHHPFVPFIAGSLLSYRIAKNDAELKISMPAAWLLLIIAAIAFSVDQWGANALASILVMIVLLGNRPVADGLSSRTGAFIGRLSFPLYLVHTLVILSVSSFVYTRLSTLAFSETIVLLVTLVVTLLVSGVSCLPFLVLDAYWGPWLNERVRAFVGRLVLNFSPIYPRS